MSTFTDTEFVEFFQLQRLLHGSELKAEFDRAWRNVEYFGSLTRIHMNVQDKYHLFYRKLTDIIETHDVILADRLAKVRALNEEMEAATPVY